MIKVTPGAKVWVVNNPGVIVELTGKRVKATNGSDYVEIRLPDGSLDNKNLALLREGSNQPASIIECFDQASFGRDRDLRCLLILQKIKGDLSDHFYSMRVGNLDFLPHQFRPVIKFLKSPTERLLIADEVGLGKTIEAILIWLELQARQKARRLLVVCPNMLVEKWRDEFRLKFDIQAGIATPKDLVHDHMEIGRKGPAYSFVKIATYSSLRPNRGEWKKLKANEMPMSDRGRFLNILQGLDSEDEPPFFDLVIMDEAHYLRNSESMVSKLGELLSKCARGLVLLSATPVSNSNKDLLTLLRLLDPDFFKNEAFFQSLSAENAPALEAFSALMAAPAQYEKARGALVRLKQSRLVGHSKLLDSVINNLSRPELLTASTRSCLIDSVEQLNVLGNYYSRTRRVHVEKQRPIRQVKVLEVTFSHEEMAFYRLVLSKVKASLRDNQSIKSAFFLIQPQMRMSSCIPAMVEAYRKGDFGSWEELEEAGSEFDDHDFVDQTLGQMDWSWLYDHDFTKLDSKFSKLKDLLIQTRGTKKIIFSFYKGTLHYLAQQIRKANIGFEVIHGEIDLDDRLQAIERFKNKNEIDVLLASEVGSEGLDLQFCHVLVNYDLPWNPMRIEQRIGRIDRIGQKADRLIIYNFKIQNTIEERLYDILNSKLKVFENSLGSLESVIGDVVEEWQMELFQSDLTPQEEETRLNQKITASGYLDHLKQELEQEAAHLMGLSPLIDRQINDATNMKRYVSGEDLRLFIDDFFANYFIGTVLHWKESDKYCFDLTLTFEAKDSLDDFIRIQQLPPLLLRGRSLSGILIDRKENAKTTLKDYHYINHFHPLIRWMVQEFGRGQQVLHPSASLILTDNILSEEIGAGVFLYCVRLWSMEGFRHFNQLAFAAYDLGKGVVAPPDISERLITRAASSARVWPGQYVKKMLRRGEIEVGEDVLTTHLVEEFHKALSLFEQQNDNVLTIKRAQVEGRFSHRQLGLEKQIETLKERERNHTMIKLAEFQIERADQIRQVSIAKLERQGLVKEVDRKVGFGLIKLESTPS